MKILVTGGAGFIGSNFVRHMLREHPECSIIVLDKLTYAGNLKNLNEAMQNPRVQFHCQDVCDPSVSESVEGCDAVVHFAAESHVDRSIENAAPFVRTNVEGTWRLLEASRRACVGRFIHVSTDEVYGSLGPRGKFIESSPLAPANPYAASKAAADLVVLSYVRTYRFPAIITRCSNNYGPCQFPEKFIPLMVAQALADQPLPVYGDGQNIRDWIHVSDHCRALDLILHCGREGEIYNVSAECELRNIDVARDILVALDRSPNLIQFVPDRPGHDRRYALDCEKLKRTLGWRPSLDFRRGLAETIRWYAENAEWLGESQGCEFRAYFERRYLHRQAAS